MYGSIIDKEKLGKFIDRQKVAFINSVDDQGFPNSKAMLPPRKREGLKAFYFSTNTSSIRVSQYRENPKASIYFYHKGLICYQGIMLKGTMEILEDEVSKRMIWRTGDKMFYSKGIKDPDYCVLKFTAITGRYYKDLKTETFSDLRRFFFFVLMVCQIEIRFWTGDKFNNKQEGGGV